MLKLLIVRHGNTFDKGDIIKRVGLRTDLALSKSGIKQCTPLALYIDKHYPNINQAFCSELIRTKQTGQLILKNQPKVYSKINILKTLNEIDYGMDDGKPESEVIKRLGLKALKAWDEKALLPPDWFFDPIQCQKDIQALTNHFIKEDKKQTILLITSNGMARFFPALLKNEECLNKTTPLKLPTASISEFTYNDINQWQCSYWGLIPS